MRKKTTKNVITFFLMLTMAMTLLTLPIAGANDPPLTEPTYAYVTASPNPVGVSQQALVVWWLDRVPPGAAGKSGERYIGQTLEVTKPDGSKQTIMLGMSDPVGGGFITYTPDQTGIYTFKFNYPGQVITGRSGTGIYSYNIAINNTYLPSKAECTLTVQQEPLTDPPSYPLPTEYWARPIEGQNTDWYTIGSNYLRGSQIVGKLQADGTAPSSAHIMWTKPLQDGGVAGGGVAGDAGLPGMTYYDGSHYEYKFMDPLIMHGRLYYTVPLANNAAGGGYACLALSTGEEIWWQNYTIRPSFGQIYAYDSMNQHGVVPNGYLWTSNFANAYDPLTGNWLFSMTSVPSGTEAYTEKGEIVRYQLDAGGKWLALWNNTAAHDLTGSTNPTDYTTTSYNQWRPIGKTVNASNAYSWNISIPWLPTDATIQTVIHNDVLLGRNGSLPSINSRVPYTMWAISLKPETKGNLLWMKTYDAPAGNMSRSFKTVDTVNRVFIFWDKETIQYTGYSLDDGSLLWGPTPSENPFNLYTHGGTGGTPATVAYGKLYSTGYSGIVYCYDTKTGNLLWNYSTAVEAGLKTPYPGYPLWIHGIADEKIYLFTSEHSANQPYWKSAKVRCLDTETGEEIWTIDSYSASQIAIADGYLVYLNYYDRQLYCIGKGPSATTVSIQNDIVTHDKSVLIKGTVTDIAAGTEQHEQAMRFPNGVPAVSDQSMSAWMEYVYMQKPRPTNITGVEVSLSVLDSNGNHRPIGVATSNEEGFYSFDWMPDIPGKYTVFARFEGSESYWPSRAVTAFMVDEAPPQPTQQAVAALPPVEMYVVGGVIAIIIAIAAVGVVLLMAIRKRA